MVPPSSHGISRVPRYSGYRQPASTFAYGVLTLCDLPSQTVRLVSAVLYAVLTPKTLLLSVWPLPRSLATTCGISVDFFSSPYLDVSVQAVPLIRLFYSSYDDRFFTCRIAPFGNLRINVYLPLPAAYRSLSRPSSAPSAKAFALRPFSLDHFALEYSISAFENLFLLFEIVLFTQIFLFA